MMRRSVFKSHSPLLYFDRYCRTPEHDVFGKPSAVQRNVAKVFRFAGLDTGQ